jgi:YVTN family beta-propeller protein
MQVVFFVLAAAAFALSSCSSSSQPAPPLGLATAAPQPPVKWSLLPGMPEYPDASDIYSAGRPGLMSPAVKDFPPRIYVPQNVLNRVSVIDPDTFKVIAHFPTEREPQHVTPSWDLKTLYVGNDQGNTLTVIDPATGEKTKTLKVDDPYNLYFTPDGKFAIVVAERLRRLDFRDPHTMEMPRSRPYRLFRRRPLPHRHLRVFQRIDQGGYRLAQSRR